MPLPSYKKKVDINNKLRITQKKSREQQRINRNCLFIYLFRQISIETKLKSFEIKT